MANTQRLAISMPGQDLCCDITASRAAFEPQTSSLRGYSSVCGQLTHPPACFAWAEPWLLAASVCVAVWTACRPVQPIVADCRHAALGSVVASSAVSCASRHTTHQALTRLPSHSASQGTAGWQHALCVPDASCSMACPDMQLADSVSPVFDACQSACRSKAAAARATGQRRPTHAPRRTPASSAAPAGTRCGRQTPAGRPTAASAPAQAPRTRLRAQRPSTAAAA